MPPKRRSSGPQSRQATLAFHGASNRVTKPRASPTGKAKVTNKSKQDPILSESITDTNLSAQAEPDLAEPTTSELAIAQQSRQEAAKPELTPEEEKASRVSEAQIKKYWKEKERARKAPRVHQEDVSLHEKVLREFDTSGQYGPCIGSARIKRWKRAHRLGLNPPIEVLAVLLKEGKANTKAQRAHIDELLGSRFVET
ncbi:DNA polymerase delta, subunit 4-domain-containing protein [Macrophomina phaseolina]|uniref:DNA polymerase delta, subunit 4-domain-containing protein n=1 Tax=Macrophomina phaseolina TaxID=35725 RepID=A0ABQ8GSB5_9PEZI|nr:DNA polymerase delta, subunit 4-domain-containing protein [Macrophomina phaseolina]